MKIRTILTLILIEFLFTTFTFSLTIDEVNINIDKSWKNSNYKVEEIENMAKKALEELEKTIDKRLIDGDITITFEPELDSEAQNLPNRSLYIDKKSRLRLVMQQTRKIAFGPKAVKEYMFFKEFLHFFLRYVMCEGMKWEEGIMNGLMILHYPNSVEHLGPVLNNDEIFEQMSQRKWSVTWGHSWALPYDYQILFTFARTWRNYFKKHPNFVMGFSTQIYEYIEKQRQEDIKTASEKELVQMAEQAQEGFSEWYRSQIVFKEPIDKPDLIPIPTYDEIKVIIYMPTSRDQVYMDGKREHHFDVVYFPKFTISYDLLIPKKNIKAKYKQNRVIGSINLKEYFKHGVQPRDEVIFKTPWGYK